MYAYYAKPKTNSTWSQQLNNRNIITVVFKFIFLLNFAVSLVFAIYIFIKNWKSYKEKLFFEHFEIFPILSDIFELFNSSNFGLL